MIVDRGAGRFGWTDEHGSDLQWETVYHSCDKPHLVRRGQGPPRAAVAAGPRQGRHRPCATLEQTGPNGAKTMQHQADMFLHTDSAGAALATKLLGAAAPKMAEQCVTQMQMFFGGLAWYVHRYPDRAAAL